MMIIMLIHMFLAPIETFESDINLIKEDTVLEIIAREDFSLDYLDPPFINQRRVNELLEKLNGLIYEQPINAKMNEQEEIVKEKSGIKLDHKKFIDRFYQTFFNERSDKIEIPVESVLPRVSSELLAEIKVRKIGEYTTFFNEGNQERSHNIDLSTEAINNYVVFPGETFSFNKVVGERTEEKGYKKAPVIVKGELSEGIGGGICQVSSTLYNAVSLRGIQIVERYSHSRSVPYVPPGRDATVSFWGPDFAFINKYQSPILIRATSDHGTMKISIHASEQIK